MSYGWNPFTRNLQTIEGKDLLAFKMIHEGWNADYKRQCQKVEDVAKSLSSFANQFGGWLLIGVDEGTPKTMKADSFPGIPVAEVPNTLETIRTASTRHVSPMLYFEYKVIEGPCDAIGLSDGRAVIVVGIPEGANPPYFHSSGRVYRRQADSSEPLAELNRSALDHLWTKGAKARQQLKDFVTMPDSESSVMSYVYLVSSPSFELPSKLLLFDDFRRTMSNPLSQGATLPFDHIYLTSDGYIARHVVKNDPRSDLFSLRWWRNGNARITIAVPLVAGVHIGRAMREPENLEYQRLRRFYSSFSPNFRNFMQIIDGSQWFKILTAFMRRYLQLRDLLPETGPVYAKIRFKGVSGHSTYIPSDVFLDGVERFGAPIAQDDEFLAPAGHELDSYVILDADSELDINTQAMTTLSNASILAFHALGVPLMYGDDISGLQDFLNTLDRTL